MSRYRDAGVMGEKIKVSNRMQNSDNAAPINGLPPAPQQNFFQPQPQQSELNDLIWSKNMIKSTPCSTLCFIF